MKSKNRLFFWATSILIALFGSSASANKSHVHGVVKLNMAVETREQRIPVKLQGVGERPLTSQVVDVRVSLEMPLDSLLGFERAPRTDAERQSVAAALVKIRDAKALFQFDPQAKCEQTDAVLVNAPVLEPLSVPARPDDDHADLEASYYFTCDKPAFLGRLDVRLFEAFRRIERIEVQIAGPQGQKKRVLRPSSPVLLWPKP